MPLANWPLKPRIRKEPLGCVLVLGAYNFPIQLTLGPYIGAIAAGCTAVLKPSEQAPNTAAVMESIIRQSLDSEAYKCVQGGIPQATALLDHPWDKIFYTGSERVGRIIARKAAEHLTPVCLELGGKNPAIVTQNADPYLAAKRLLWAKCLNAGQVCVGQNYILVQESILPTFINHLRTVLNEFYPNGAKNSDSYARIVNITQFNRMKKMLDASDGKILIGGSMDARSLFIEPTVIRVHSRSDSLLAEESFGPFIPVLPFSDLSEAISIVNDVESTPLGIYPFGNHLEVQRILDETRSGGASINDGFFHASIPMLEFGGVGSSGQGSYRGRASFDCFTHRRAVTETPWWMERMINVRYPPYTEAKLKQYMMLMGAKPNFDREGRVRRTWFSWLISLGGRGTNALGRWIGLAVGQSLTLNHRWRADISSSSDFCNEICAAKIDPMMWLPLLAS